VSLLTEAIQIFEKAMPVRDPVTAMARAALSAGFFLQGRIEESEALLRDAVATIEAELGPEHPRLGALLINYSVVLKQLGKKQEARKAEKRAEALLAGIGSDPWAKNTVDFKSLVNRRR
jgi:hypothetical protein